MTIKVIIIIIIITAILKKRMNFRDRLQRKAIKTKDPFIWDQFRIVKNQVNWEINSAKKAYYENAFNTCCRDQRRTWKTINELASRKCSKTVINEMEYNGVNSGDQTYSRNANLLFHRNWARP